MLTIWVQLDLQIGRHNLSTVQDTLELAKVEVADAYRLGKTASLKFLESLPSVFKGHLIICDELSILLREEIVAWKVGCGPVDQIHIDIIDTEASEALLQMGFNELWTMESVPQLGGEENLLA